MKIVLNNCYGGFGLSDKATALYEKKTGIRPTFDMYDSFAFRTSPSFIEVVEELGEEASGDYSNLQVIKFTPENDYWMVNEYDGLESIIYPDIEHHGLEP